MAGEILTAVVAASLTVRCWLCLCLCLVCPRPMHPLRSLFPDCKTMIQAAKEKDDAAELVLENANKAFNATVKEADTAVAAAVQAKEAANTALVSGHDARPACRIGPPCLRSRARAQPRRPRPPQDTAQDADNAANIQMQTKSNEFNNAVLRLQDVITLCSQPQPPSDCHTRLQGAQDNVKGTPPPCHAARAWRLIIC